jgi:hypothetical protein
VKDSRIPREYVALSGDSKVTLPYDLSKPETRPYRLVVFTDEETGLWIAELARESEVEPSLVAHRILKHARDAATVSPESERRQHDRRSA